MPTAGQFVTAFALTYAMSAPISATALGNFGRKPAPCPCAFRLCRSNLLAALSGTFVQLMGARILLALCAATYMPAANAVAVTLVPPAKRGTAISIVTGGITVAVALGAPLGTQIAAFGNWRATFMMVALVAAIGRRRPALRPAAHPALSPASASPTCSPCWRGPISSPRSGR